MSMTRAQIEQMNRNASMVMGLAIAAQRATERTRKLQEDKLVQSIRKKRFSALALNKIMVLTKKL